MLFKKANNDRAEEMKQYISVNVSVNYDTVKPHIEAVERDFIKPLLGKSLYDELQSKYNEGTTDEKWLELISYMQRSTINLAFWKGFYQLIIKFSEKGPTVPEGEHTGRLYRYQEEGLRDSFKQEGFNVLDDALTFIESELTTFDKFKTSKHYTLRAESFVPSTESFNEVYDINNSRLVFLRMRPFMSVVEDFVIAPKLGTTLYNAVKENLTAETKSGKLTALNDYIKKAIVWQTVADALRELQIQIKDSGLFVTTTDTNTKNHKKERQDKEVINNKIDRADKNAGKYLGLLFSFIENNIDDYPDYAKFAGDNYSPEAPVKRNNTDKKTFWT